MTTERTIRVALADDHKIFRDGIKMALRDRDYLKILWEAEDGKDMMHRLRIKLARCVAYGHPDAGNRRFGCH
jgi:DNA-binding NarL/FixJ family response regulator